MEDKLCEDNVTDESGRRPKWKQFIKIALPHVALYLFLFFYLICGAAIFRQIEYQADLDMQKKKFANIGDRYRDITGEVGRMSAHLNSEEREKVQDRIHDLLVQVSRIHEGPNLKMNRDLSNEDVLPPRWDQMSAVLYALSILTTTGYSYAVPHTRFGQCVAIVYGLIGIPLMVLAAVDIGRFLSHIVLKVYTRYCAFSHRIFGTKKKKIVRVVNRGAWKVARHSSLSKFRREPNVEEQNGETKGLKEEHDEENETPEAEETVAHVEETKRLPLSLNASILLLFCMLGGLMYLAAGSNKTFLEAFFVTFNLVANLTMGEMPTDLHHVLTLIYIFLFVTFGVAVLSMCAELAALELKELFLKIHYFGRKINFKRKKRAEHMEVEVKELLKIIEEIRKKYPEKEHITTLDILQYMHEIGRSNEDSSSDRRDTIAFMPQTVETLKFADEGDQEERSLSRVDELTLDRTVDVWAFVTEAELVERLRHQTTHSERRILGRLQRQKRQSTLNSIHYPHDECVNLL